MADGQRWKTTVAGRVKNGRRNWKTAGDGERPVVGFLPKMENDGGGSCVVDGGGSCAAGTGRTTENGRNWMNDEERPVVGQRWSTTVAGSCAVVDGGKKMGRWREGVKIWGEARWEGGNRNEKKGGAAVVLVSKFEI